MSFARDLTLLLRGRAAIISTDPVHTTDSLERLSVDMVWNRQTHERRVITNMSHAVAVDVHSDLSRSASREGSHAYASALGQALAMGPGGTI